MMTLSKGSYEIGRMWVYSSPSTGKPCIQLPTCFYFMTPDEARRLAAVLLKLAGPAPKKRAKCVAKKQLRQRKKHAK